IQNGVVTNNNFITIDGPPPIDPTGHNTFTFASSINASGQIVGYYYDYNTTDPQNPVLGPQHGFLVDADSTGNLTNFTTIDPTGSTFTQPTSINASGEIVGWYHDAGNSFHGFIDIGGNITTFDAPGSNITFTEALSVNDSGQIVGVYNDADGHQHGFLRESNGTFITIDVPGSLGPLGSTMPASINDSGQIVGTYVDSSGVGHGFATDIDQALTTTPEVFHYTAGTGTVDLGNTINNDLDPNPGGGPISFLSFGSASFEAQSFIPGLTVAFQGNVITIT